MKFKETDITDFTKCKERLHKLYVDTNVNYFDKIEKTLTNENTTIHIVNDRNKDLSNSVNFRNNNLFIFKPNLFERFVMTGGNWHPFLILDTTLPVIKNFHNTSFQKHSIELLSSQIKEYINNNYNRYEYRIIYFKHNDKFYMLLPSFYN